MSDYTTIPCKFGKLAIRATNANHVYATSNPFSGRDFLPFNIRGVEYTVSAHLYRYSDGSWHIGEEKSLPYQRLYHGLYMSRRDTKEPSGAAHAAAGAEIESVVGAWIRQHPDKIQDAKTKATEAELDRAEAERKELSEKIKTLDAKIAKLRKELGK